MFLLSSQMSPLTRNWNTFVLDLTDGQNFCWKKFEREKIGFVARRYLYALHANCPSVHGKPDIIKLIIIILKNINYVFLPTPPPRGAWVFRWQVSPLPPFPHLQICQRPLTKTWCQRPLTIETENAVRAGGRGSFAVMRSCFFLFVIHI